MSLSWHSDVEGSSRPANLDGLTKARDSGIGAPHARPTPLARVSVRGQPPGATHEEMGAAITTAPSVLV